MPSVLFVTYNLNSYSGAAFQAMRLAKHLNCSERNVIVCNFSQELNGNAEIEGIKIYNLKPDSIISIPRFISIFLKHDITIAHFHVYLKKFLLVTVLLKRKLILKSTLIGDDDFKTLMATKYPTVTKLIFRNITRNIVLSNYSRKINSKYLPVTRICKIPNGVEIPTDINLVNKTNNVFCTVGVVCRRKQTKEIIRYFHLNYSDNSDVKLYIIGPNRLEDEVPEFDLDYYLECCQYIKNNNLKGKVIFLGKLDKDQVLSYYKKSIAFIFFSLKEGMPNVVLEAMANNCVPIVTGMDGVSSEIISPDEDGFILSSELERNITVEELKHISNSGKCFEKIKSGFSLEFVASKYKNMYDFLSSSN